MRRSLDFGAKSCNTCALASQHVMVWHTIVGTTFFLFDVFLKSSDYFFVDTDLKQQALKAAKYHCWNGVIIFRGDLSEKIAKIVRYWSGDWTLKSAESAVPPTREFSATVGMGSPSYSVAI